MKVLKKELGIQWERRVGEVREATGDRVGEGEVGEVGGGPTHLVCPRGKQRGNCLASMLGSGAPDEGP